MNSNPLPVPGLQTVTFQAARNGGVCAKFWGRIAFPERSGVPPEPGDTYQVLAVRENEKKTVYFLTLGKRFSTQAEREAKKLLEQQQRIAEEQRRQRVKVFCEKFADALSQALKERYPPLEVKLEWGDSIQLRYHGDNWRYESASSRFIYIYAQDDTEACKLHKNERPSKKSIFLCCSAQCTEQDVTDLVAQAMAWIATCYEEWSEEAEAARQESLQKFPTVQDYINYERNQDRLRAENARRAYEDPDWYQSTRYDYW